MFMGWPISFSNISGFLRRKNSSKRNRWPISFSNVSGRLYQSGMPVSKQELNLLRRRGFRTILSIDPMDESLQSHARKIGLNVVNVPDDYPHDKLSNMVFHGPHDKLSNMVFHGIAECKAGKILLHCTRGFTARYIGNQYLKSGQSAVLKTVIKTKTPGRRPL